MDQRIPGLIEGFLNGRGVPGNQESGTLKSKDPADDAGGKIRSSAVVGWIIISPCPEIS
jgi:hypothetical protein